MKQFSVVLSQGITAHGIFKTLRSLVNRGHGLRVYNVGIHQDCAVGWMTCRYHQKLTELRVGDVRWTMLDPMPLNKEILGANFFDPTNGSGHSEMPDLPIIPREVVVVALLVELSKRLQTKVNFLHRIYGCNLRAELGVAELWLPQSTTPIEVSEGAAKVITYWVNFFKLNGVPVKNSLGALKILVPNEAEIADVIKAKKTLSDFKNKFGTTKLQAL